MHANVDVIAEVVGFPVGKCPRGVTNDNTEQDVLLTVRRPEAPAGRGRKRSHSGLRQHDQVLDGVRSFAEHEVIADFFVHHPRRKAHRMRLPR